MALTNKGQSRKPPEELILRIGSELSFVSFKKGRDCLTFGQADGVCYFRLNSPHRIIPLCTRPISVNSNAVKAFAIFRKKGFCSELRKLYSWRDANVVFAGEHAVRKRAKTDSLYRSYGKNRTDPKAFQLDTHKRSKRQELPKSIRNKIRSLEVLGSGTCFNFGGPRYFITNYHVVKDGSTFVIESQGFITTARIIFKNEASDLALLQSQRKVFHPPLELAQISPDIADRVFTVGFPDPLVQGKRIKYTEGSISSLSGVKDNKMQYQVSVPLQPGNSGGPLVDTDGKIVGVVQATLNPWFSLRMSGTIPQGVNFAVSHAALRKFIRMSGIQLPKSTSGQSGEIQDQKTIVSNVINSTYKIDVYCAPAVQIDESAQKASKWQRLKEFVLG